MIYNIYTAPKPKPKPIELIEWQLKLIPHTASGSIRVVAVDMDGERIPDGNLIKFKRDGTAYRYHTVNPALGLSLNAAGRINRA